MWTDPLTAFPLQHPEDSQVLEHRQIYFDAKSDLDKAVETASRYGWILLSRTYSSEKGHGANLLRSRLNQAA